MDLVNKEDYISLALNFVHKTLNTALELSAELSSRNKRGQVEQIDLLVSKIERNIALVDPLGNTLRNGSLADTRFTDKAGLDTLKICVAYKKPDGTVTENFPATLEELEGCEPVYEEFPGFNEDISKASSFDELPENCKKYIARLEELVGCHVSMVGIGPDRAQILER